MLDFDINLRTAALACFTLLILYLIYALIFHPNYISSIRNIPGPPAYSLLSGNLPAVFEAEPDVIHDAWIEQYGSSVIQYRGFFGENRLYLADPKAINHVLLTHPYDYPKPTQLRGQLARILGRGILFAEGDDHKRQRRIMNLPFTQAMVNTYQPIFQEQANKMRDLVMQELSTPAISEKEKTAHGDWQIIEITRWLSRCTLDVIGLAGFDYEFGALDNTENKLAKLFSEMLKARQMTMFMLIMGTLVMYFPFLTKLPTKQAREMQASLKGMEEEGQNMLAIRKEWEENGELDGKKDLMSLMYKASSQASSKKDKMTDDEIMGQITTFILAGHETSATTLTWTLMHLSRNPAMQQRLRDEIREAKVKAAAEGRDELTAEELTALPFLDALVKESLRCEPPVFMTVRGAGKDDVIPLHRPIIGKDGSTITSIPVKKDQVIMIGIDSLHKSTEIYGADAKEFNPDRWLKQDGLGDLQLAKGYTVWSQILSFLGGPRGCIGYRFALLETKTILATLIDSFEVLERDETGTKFLRRSNIITRPILAGEEELGARLPLRMRRID